MKFLLAFMRMCLDKKEIPQSWGISNIIISDNSVSFNVFGSKYQGRITVTEYNSVIVVNIDDKFLSFSNASELFEWLDKRVE